ncbi:MAG: VOC family protein [Chloroflexi bacterium]|nr:VOC family protein [Chloroflexota bacterium]MBV9599540.1 VOC family protein [Chloroflexota bacterium]
MSRVVGLGHIGIYVRDLDKMTAFYRDFMGMQVTKQSPGRAVFLSSDPERVDHEIALMTGREAEQDPHLIQQISLRVDTLDDLRDFKRRILQEGYKIDNIVTHLSAIGCYFFDPEGNRNEVFWLTGRPSWVMVGVPIDIDRPDDEILGQIDRVWEQTRHVAMGTPPDAAAVAAMQEAYREAAPVGAR